MADVTGRVATSCIDILLAVGQRLADKKVVQDSSRVFYVIRPNVPHFGAEHDVLIRPYGFTVNPGHVDAGGRVTTVADRHVTIICRTRLQVDEANRENKWLLHETRGHLAFEESVVDALHLYDPEDTDGNLMLVEPMRLLRVDGLEKDPKDAAWGSSKLDWQILYYLKLDQADQ